MLFEVREALGRTCRASSSVSFELRRTVQRETRRVLGFATRHGVKPAGFWALPLDMERNPPGFGLCHSTWSETRRVLGFATRHGAKPAGFWALPLDMKRNPPGFGLCHLTWSETRRVLGFATSLNETRRVLLRSVANADRSPIGCGAQRTSRIRKVTRISCIYLIYAYF